MTDLNVLLETALLLAVPFVPVAIGLLLRRKFKPGTGPLTSAQKAGRLAGSILLWGGIAGLLFMVVVLLNYKGRL